MHKKLENVFQGLKLISTKGEDTIVMANCLVILQQAIKELQEQETVPKSVDE